MAAPRIVRADEREVSSLALRGALADERSRFLQFLLSLRVDAIEFSDRLFHRRKQRFEQICFDC
jgi:hypothetical protein